MGTKLSEPFLLTDLRETRGTQESSRVYMETNIRTGATRLWISKTYIETYPVTEYAKVMELYEQLNRGGGRTIPRLKDLTK